MTRAFVALGVLAVALVATGAATARGGTAAIAAPSYMLVTSLDASTLAARNADVRRPMASITKLMTVVVAREHLQPETVVTVPAAATRVGESSIYLRPGQRLPARDLYIGALVPSANDAATALAIVSAHGSLPRFVAWMNRKAKVLGLHDTHFENPHGLDAVGHYASARDLTKLLAVALDDPLVRRYADESTAVLSNGVRVDSTDNLIGSMPGFIGGKTGHTSKAGWSQVAAVRRDGVTLTAVVLGDSTEGQRDGDLAALLRLGLASFRLSHVVVPHRTYGRVELGWGLPPLAVRASRAVTRPVSTTRSLTESVVVPSVARLPVRRGEQLGWVTIRDGRRLVARAPLVATRSVAEPTGAQKARYLAGRTLDHFFGWLPG